MRSGRRPVRSGRPCAGRGGLSPSTPRADEMRRPRFRFRGRGPAQGPEAQRDVRVPHFQLDAGHGRRHGRPQARHRRRLARGEPARGPRASGTRTFRLTNAPKSCWLHPIPAPLRPPRPCARRAPVTRAVGLAAPLWARNGSVMLLLLVRLAALSRAAAALAGATERPRVPRSSSGRSLHGRCAPGPGTGAEIGPGDRIG